MPRYRIVPKSPLRGSQRREETAYWYDYSNEENYYRGERGQFQRCDFTVARCSKCHCLTYAPAIYGLNFTEHCSNCGRKMRRRYE